MRKYKKTTQELSSQELASIENYLARTYTDPVCFSRHVLVSKPSSKLKLSVAIKSGDVFTLKGDTIYHKPKQSEPRPLTPVAQGEGLFVVTDKEDDNHVHLELVRVTDFASAFALA